MSKLDPHATAAYNSYRELMSEFLQEAEKIIKGKADMRADKLGILDGKLRKEQESFMSVMANRYS